MNNKLNFIITGATAAMLLLPMQTDAQKLESGLRDRVPVSVLQKAERTTPAALRKLDEKVKASYPKLFKGKVLNQNKFSGLKEMRSGGIMPSMALEPRVPLKAAKYVSGRELWGAIVSDNSWSQDNPLYGLYKFNAVSNIGVEAIGLNSQIIPNGGGAIIGDKMYVVYYFSFWGIYASLYQFDTNTWEQIGESETLEDLSLIATETATAENGTIYGAFYSADGQGLELGIADYENKTRSTIGTLSHMYVALGITKENVLYGVAEDGGLYKIDTSTAQETLVGETGLNLLDSDGAFYLQSGEIDQKDNTFYWACVDNAENSKLYTINLTTGAAELVGEFTNKNIVTMMTVPEALAEGAPTAATDLAANFANGSLSGTVSFKLPTKNIKGDDLTGEVTYTITEGANTLKTGTGTPGANVTENVTIAEDGKKSIVVTTSNSEGKGQNTKITQYIGYDTPKAVENLKLDINAETGDANLTWDAVTAGVNDGFIGDIKYDVVRYPGETVVAKGVTATSITDKLNSRDLTAYAYGVKAYNDKKTGAEARTDYKLYGDPITPPYAEGFDSKDAMAYYTVINNNDDNSTWKYYQNSDGSGEVRYVYNSKNAADDWLITPPLKVEKGKTYAVKFKAKSYRSSYLERLEVKYGSTNTVEGMKNVIMEPTDLPGDAFQEYTKEITASEDGTMYIGFHAISDADKFYLELDDISVGVGMSTTAPDAVSELTAVPGDKGAKSATISFTAPSKAIDGSDLTGKMTIKIKRDGTVIKELTDVAPGSKQSFVDTTPENGFNSYSVTSANAEGEGRSTESVTIYVGIDKPNLPELNAADQTTSIKVSWTDSDKGENGGYVDTQNTSHKFYNLVESAYGTTVELAAEVPAGTSSYETAIKTDEGDQTLQQYGVSAVNEVGEGEIGLTPSVIIGKPYTIPFVESAPGRELTNGLWWIARDNFSLGLVEESSDGDGGCFAMLSGADDGYGTLGSGKIKLTGATNPMVIFSHKATAASNAKITVSVQKPDGTVEDLTTIDAAKDADSWVRASVALKSEYTSLPYVILRFKATANADELVYLDEFYVRDVYESDLTLKDITAPKKIKKGETAKVDVTVSNFGSNKAKNYTVKLYAGDKLVESKEEKAELAPFESKTYSFEYASSVMDNNNAVELKAEVVYDTDLNPDDNAKSISVAYDISNKPRPATVNATENGDGSVKVTWSAVVESAVAVEDGFEECESWAKDEFGGWTTALGSTPDNAKTGGPFRNPYPGQGDRFAFIVMDPLNEWITQDYLDANPSLIPHAGNKYVASFFKYNPDSETDEFYDADNWLISPALSGKKQTISFWASNNNTTDTAYPETFDILYSKEGTDISKFVKVGETRTASSGTWEEYTAELPEGATYFAIHNNTGNETNFVFMIDDVKYEAGSGKVTGYKVYRDGELLKTMDADKVEFTDGTAEKGKTYVYAVTAVFADGESEATIATAITTDIESVENVIKASSYDVYTIDGKLIGTGMKTLKNLKSGSYIINDQKVIIR
ncbi:choice-of-anchor J domain-containing protein [Prevotella sp.]|uniref:choice-of-anchor J domain-containing protein n=1 Tax=Prevotella sp. TaxID=59823 RepID=UPI003FD8E573